MANNECPTCKSDDYTTSGWSPMYGDTLECCDCGTTWNPEENGPTDDDWINAAYLRAAGLNPSSLG